MTPTQRKAMQQALADMMSFESGTGGLYRGEFAESITALRAALAEQPAEQMPVAWEWRWFDANPYTVTSGQWSEWKRVEPRNPLCTLEDALNEFRAYIAQGQRYELRALHTAPQPAKQPLTDDEIDLIGFRAVGKVDCQTLKRCVPYGTEIKPLVREIARAIEAAHGITGETK